MNGSNDPTQAVIWLNGALLNADEARVSPFDRGFLYGDGVFETMRADVGHVHRLDGHQDRLRASTAALRIELDPAVDISAACDAVLSANGLASTVARLKIMVTRGRLAGAGLPRSSAPTVIVTAERYQPPDEALYERGWRLISAQGLFAAPLASMKSLNYLACLLAKQQAMDAGADDALIPDFRGAPVETSSAALLVRSPDGLWIPDSEWQLPSVTRAAVIRLLQDEGTEVARRPATLAGIVSAEAVFATNALIGVICVQAVDDRRIAVDAEAVRRFNASLFG
jgi:branched-chain amino acid aminotransferase